MIRKLGFVLLLMLAHTCAVSKNYQRIKIAKKLFLLKISDNAYVHVSYMNDNIPCNGFIFVDNGKAFLIETPKEPSDTRLLLDFIKNKLHLEIVGFVTNDWHSDSMGGVGLLNDAGIPTYGSQMTIDIAKTKNLPHPVNAFNDEVTLKLNDRNIVCYYPGAAHTKDNVVTYMPSLKILFAGCMVKELKAKDLGYTDDGDVKEYPATLRKVKQKFPNVQVVIPGHGDFGGMELVEHTLKMAEERIR